MVMQCKRQLCAKVIQSLVRGALVRQKLHLERRHCAASTLQRAARTWQRNGAATMEKRRLAAIHIERSWRGRTGRIFAGRELRRHLQNKKFKCSNCGGGHRANSTKCPNREKTGRKIKRKATKPFVEKEMTKDKPNLKMEILGSPPRPTTYIEETLGRHKEDISSNNGHAKVLDKSGDGLPQNHNCYNL